MEVSSAARTRLISVIVAGFLERGGYNEEIWS